MLRLLDMPPSEEMPAPELLVRERDVAEQTVLTEQRHVYVGQLAWIREAAARLTATAARCGGVAGEHFVIFHGIVTTDSDGLVEVCVPVRHPPEDPAELAWRVEAAHRDWRAGYPAPAAGKPEPPERSTGRMPSRSSQWQTSRSAMSPCLSPSCRECKPRAFAVPGRADGGHAEAPGGHGVAGAGLERRRLPSQAPRLFVAKA